MTYSKRRPDHYQRIGGLFFVAAGCMTLATTIALFVGTIKLLF